MFGLEWWGDDNFIVEDGVVKVNYLSQPSLLEIVEKVRDDGMRGPMILRFPHLIKKQIESLFSAFHEARDSFNYSGNFHALFPLKVNQYPTFIEELQVAGKPFNYGLEAGSKAELLLAMAYNHDDAPITVNGFKDKEMIDLGFIAKAMGHNITLIMEGLNEIELLVELAKEKPKFVPNIGIRLRLHNSSPGIWSKSGGINAKFGLTSTELILALDLLKKSGLTHLFKMLHFHIGSQMSEINALKKAIKESGNIYADLINLGATNLNAVNIGGGLLIEYAQHEHERQKRYSLEEFANDVVYQFQVIALKKGVMVPDIYTESGRFIAAPHALMITPVIELFSEEYSLKALRLKVENPPLIEELKSLHDTINEDNAIEYMHDALEHLESLLTLFDLGYIDLVDRSNSEVLSASIVKKALMLDNEEYPRFQQFQERVQERYLINFSLFQSLPDYWGLGQKFPMMPIHHLKRKRLRPATLWDITCDSDGEMSFDKESPTYLHNIDLEEENYFLGFFLLGAYQETLGMHHNLFSRPNELVIDITKSSYNVKTINYSENLLTILSGINYVKEDIVGMLHQKVEDNSGLTREDREKLFVELAHYMHENGYLKTTR